MDQLQKDRALVTEALGAVAHLADMGLNWHADSDIQAAAERLRAALKADQERG